MEHHKKVGQLVSKNISKSSTLNDDTTIQKLKESAKEIKPAIKSISQAQVITKEVLQLKVGI